MDKIPFSQTVSSLRFSVDFILFYSWFYSGLIFYEIHDLCVFYSFHNKYACFLICENYFLLCFCFKNLDLLDWQTIQFDFSLSTLFVIFTSCRLKLCVKSLHPKQYGVPSSFATFTGFIFYCVFFILCNLAKWFWQSISYNLILLSDLI